MDDILELDSIYEGLYEYYVNDYIIFEGILRRDYYEVTGILNEDGNKNFLQGLWDKVIEIINNAKYKIIQMVDSIINKSLDKKLEKYKKMLDDNKELINKTDYSEFVSKNKYLIYSEKLAGFYATYSVQLNWSMADLDRDDIDEKIKIYEDSVKKGNKLTKKIYDENIETLEDYNLDSHIKNKLKERLEERIEDLHFFRKQKLDIIKNFDKLQKEVTALKRNAKRDNNEKDLERAQKAHKIFSLAAKDNINTFKTLNKIYTTDLNSIISLIITAVKYAKAQEKSSNKEDSQNASYIDYDMDYINALSEATIYELD